MSTNNNLNLITTDVNKLILSNGVGNSYQSSSSEYAVSAGALGNVLESDGTNFLSTTPSSLIYTPYTFSLQTNVSGTLASARTYFLATGSIPELFAAETGSQRFVFPKAGVISRLCIVARVAGTLASAGNCTVRINLNGAINNVISNLTLTAVTTSRNVVLSINVNAGDYITFSIVSPTWTTPPSQVSFSIGAIIT